MIFIIVMAMTIFTIGTLAVADDFQKLKMKLYVNEMEVDAPVYTINDAADESNIYVDLIAVFEKLDAQIKGDLAGIVYITGKRVYNLKITVGESIVIFKNSTFTGLKLALLEQGNVTVMVEDRVFIRYEIVTVLIGASEQNENEIRLYSRDFEKVVGTPTPEEYVHL